MRDTSNQTPFETSDLTLAAYLFASGTLLQNIQPDPSDSRRKVFVFEEPTEDLLSIYQSGKAEINVLAFDNALNTLRNMVRGVRQ